MNTEEKNNGIHEECGVFGIYGSEDAANICYYGLHSLQHRGQEGCGIVAANEGTLKCVKGAGLVNNVFNEQNLASLKGNISIGQVLYTNAGGGELAENIQPIVFHHRTGDFAISYNGKLVNADRLRKYLEDKGSLFLTSSDCELIANLIKKDAAQAHVDRIHSIMDALNMVEGAFAFLIMTGKRIYACRDKHGLKPLSLGRLKDGSWVVASESCAFEVIGAEFVRDVEPGEIISIDHHGIRSNHFSSFKHYNMCSMEYIYFARPDSDIDGCNVHTFRKESGKLLYKESPVEADIVIGVPDSSLSAAIGYAEASGIPYEMGLVKSKYVARTFIQPSQSMREKGVRMKLSAVRSIVGGKRVIMVDDSIVRGTTSKRIVRLLKEAGATEVHVRIASPAMKHPCYYGVDTSTYEELISAQKSVEEVKEYIGADSLAFLSTESLMLSGNRCEMCMACFDGKYPTDLYLTDENATLYKRYQIKAK
ncbi:MAG: amidophosphoribosyltransferase [Tidjanibacter sp.]|nr:amidophosphoribosyltransferase [Tidjanibacter sp.]